MVAFVSPEYFSRLWVRARGGVGPHTLAQPCRPRLREPDQTGIAASPGWQCVYELASFCKLHRGSLDQKLLLLSLKWPRTLSPFKTAQPSSAELQQFASFSCLTAQCYKPSDRADLLAAIRQDWERSANQESNPELPASQQQSHGARR